MTKSYEQLVQRVQRKINSPRAQSEHCTEIQRGEDDSADDWTVGTTGYLLRRTDLITEGVWRRAKIQASKVGRVCRPWHHVTNITTAASQLCRRSATVFVSDHLHQTKKTAQWRRYAVRLLPLLLGTNDLTSPPFTNQPRLFQHPHPRLNINVVNINLRRQLQ